jgi:hypothetical protein
MSNEWKWKRDKRLAIDGKCSICGRPFDLQVHHMTYSNCPNERITDLITVCRSCHERIESKKAYPGYDSFNIVNELIIKQFIQLYKDRDYSAGGDMNLCELTTIKKNLFPFMKEHGANLDHISGTSIVQEYFRNRRYEVIFQYMEKGYPKEEAKKRLRFSSTMINKVYDEPEICKRLLKFESEDF